MKSQAKTNADTPQDYALEGWHTYNKHHRLENASEAFPDEDYGLPTAKPILVDREKSTFLMQCGEAYYFWNDISGHVSRIDAPKNLAEILQALDGSARLETTRLQVLEN